MANHWLLRWLERYCDPTLWEGIQGDLDELYAYEVEAIGRLSDE
jgi:hypothetical protein